jgi:hypothetical protein
MPRLKEDLKAEKSKRYLLEKWMYTKELEGSKLANEWLRIKENQRLF